METAVRVILLVLGLVIVAGIVWDSRRTGLFKKKSKKDSKEAIAKNVVIETPTKELTEPYFDDVRLIVKPEKQEPTLSDEYPEEIIALSIMARKPHLFSGKKLKNAFAASHLYYGDMQIFHRFDNIDGTGASLFSVVSSVEPGTFELSTLDNLETPGITLFFVTTTPNQSVYVFELMLRTAKQLAVRLEGDLKDDRQRPLTPQVIEHYRERLRMQKPVSVESIA